MKADVSFEYTPNRQYGKDLLQSSEARSLVGQKAKEVAARATAKGRGIYGSRTRKQKTSVHGYAFTANYEAMLDQARNDTLTNSL